MLLRRPFLAVTDHYLFCFCTFQKKLDTVYRLRQFIREGVDVDEGLRSVTAEFGDDGESPIREALQSKCPEDGQNLLMYAATQGSEVWFLRLIGDIKSRVSKCVISNSVASASENP